MASEVTARRFVDKVAIVTGSSASPSIGRSTARRLAREGASVVLNGRSPEQLAATEAELTGEGLTVIAVQGSAGEDGMADRLVDAALDRFGRIDLLACTVGGASYSGPWEEMDRDALVDTFTLNTWPTLSLVQSAVRGGLGEGGAVVNISSGSPKKTTPAMLAYAAAKAALNAMTRTLARDLGPRGIRVNAVAPGLTRTTATRGFWERDGGEAAGRNVLLGRLPDAEDIANAVVFLLSPEAGSITGVNIDVDSGDHLMNSGWSPFAPGQALDTSS